MRSTLLTLLATAALSSACTLQPYPAPVTFAAVDSVSHRMDLAKIPKQDTSYQSGHAWIEERVQRDTVRSSVVMRCSYELNSLESLDVTVRDASNGLHQGSIPLTSQIKNNFPPDYALLTCASIHDALRQKH